MIGQGTHLNQATHRHNDKHTILKTGTSKNRMFPNHTHVGIGFAVDSDAAYRN
jgi:hypothetical protein